MRQSRVLGFLLAGLVPAALFAAPPSAAPRPSSAPSHGSPFPGGLLDSSGRTAFLSSAGGGIQAVDLMTGDVLWHSNEAEVPLLVAGNRLYAQAGVKRNRL